jgi:hypothetical protein
VSPSLRGIETNSEVFRLPPVPEKYDKTYKATHYSEPDKIYEVNLFRLTCTCPDYRLRESRYSENDIRLVCKHILEKLKYAKLFKMYDSLTANLLHCSTYFGDDLFVRCEIATTQYILSTNRQSNWVNVHLALPPKGSKTVVRFGFDVCTKTWQYEQPKNARQVEECILRFL